MPNTLNPLDWTAGPFLLLYSVCAAAVLIGLSLWRNQIDGHGRGFLPDRLGVLHWAYLAGGAERASAAALVALLEAGAAVPDRKRGVVQVDRTTPVPPEFEPFRAVGGGETSRAAFQSQFARHWGTLHDDLVRDGLVPGDDAVGGFRLWGGLAVGAMAALGVAKIVVGASRGRPVGYLVLLLLITVAIGAFLLLRRPHRSQEGTSALAEVRRSNARAVRAPLPAELPLAFALSGPAVLAGREYGWFVALKPGSGDGGSGCGGGDGGGGSGCGGGGGCGGCS